MRRLLLGVGALAAAGAHAEPQATVRVGDHPGFGRVVFDLPNPAAFQMAERGNRVFLIFAGNPSIGMPDAVPRNVVSVLGGEGSATLTIAPGARIRSAQVGSRVVIDILDPAPRPRPAQSPAAAAPAPSVLTPIPAAPAAAAASAPPAAAPPAAAPPAAAITAPPPTHPAPIVPESAHAETAPVPTSTPEPAAAAPAQAAGPLRLPAGPAIGAAAFRRGDLAVVVFDAPVAVDADEFARRPEFAAATLRESGRGSVLTLPLAAGANLDLARSADAWLVGAGATKAPAADPVPVADGIAFPIEGPGRVISIRDPLTGHALLVGTSRAGAEKGRSVRTGRTAPGYVVLPTWLGVAVEPNADQIDLRASLSGFTLVTPDAASPAKTAEAVKESQFGLALAPTPVLMDRLRSELARTAALPPRARGPERVAAARTMLALGMAAEAQALLALAQQDDPAATSDPSIRALAGMAAVLAARPTEADGLDAPGLEPTREVELWRALRDAGQGKAADLGSYMDLMPIYPSAIRLRLLPMVAEAAVQGGRTLEPGVAALPQLGIARAMQTARAGNTEQALAAYDAIDRGRDADASVRAAMAAAELRLAALQLEPAAAADIFERQTLRWRGDRREIGARLRAAELRTQAGQWRVALDWLRETEKLFPEAKDEIAPRKTSVFKALASRSNDAISPLDLVTLAGDYADSLPPGPEGDAVAALLADKLVALDLPSRAIPVLEKLVQGSASPRAKTEFALRLGQLQLDDGQAAKAEAMLGALDRGQLAADRVEAVMVLKARARAATGDVTGALEVLGQVPSRPALELRASLAAKSGAWTASLEALTSLAEKTIPSEGVLTEEQQDLVLRQAIAAVQAGDDAALKRVATLAPRITSKRADAFRIMTASAVQSSGDLPRAARELAMTRSFSSRFEAGAGR